MTHGLVELRKLCVSQTANVPCALDQTSSCWPIAEWKCTQIRTCFFTRDNLGSPITLHIRGRVHLEGNKTLLPLHFNSLVSFRCSCSLSQNWKVHGRSPEVKGLWKLKPPESQRMVLLIFIDFSERRGFKNRWVQLSSQLLKYHDKVYPRSKILWFWCQAWICIRHSNGKWV